MRCCSSTSSSSSSTEAAQCDDSLRKPLLGDDDYAEKQQLSDDEDEISESSSSSMESWCDSLLAWFVLPCLLWLDFWLVLHNNSASSSSSSDASSSSLPNPAASSWTGCAPAVTMASVHFSFFMFIVATFMYRKTLEENCCESVLMLLVPEIAMNVMLLLIFANQTLAAYLVLLAVILALSIVVVVVSAIRLGCVYEVTDNCQDEEQDEEVDVEDGTLAVVVPSIRR